MRQGLREAARLQGQLAWVAARLEAVLEAPLALLAASDYAASPLGLPGSMPNGSMPNGSMPPDTMSPPASAANSAPHPVNASVLDGVSKLVPKLSRGPTPPALHRGATPTAPYLATEPATSTALAAVTSAGVLVGSGDGSPPPTQGDHLSPAPPAGSPDGWLASDEAVLLRRASPAARLLGLRHAALLWGERTATLGPLVQQAAVKQEELATCLALLQQQQQQQGRPGDATLHAAGSNAQPAAPASSWLSTSSSFPRNVLRRVSDALGGSERDLGVN